MNNEAVLYRLNGLPPPPRSVALQKVCKRMCDRRGNKKDTTYQCEAYTQALQKVFGMAFRTEEDAMVYPQSF